MSNKIFNFIFKNYLSLIFIALFIIYLIFSIAFLPFPVPILHGWDPSWQYGISRAAEDNLIFGKDIIFTYGSLGYLIHGAYLKSNYWQILTFHWFIHFVFFLVIFVRVITIKSNIRKLLIILPIIASIYIIKINSWIGLLADYQLLYAYLTIFTFDNLWQKYPKILSSLLGIIAGFCLVTKFSLGIYTLGFLVIDQLIKLYQAVISKSDSEIKENILRFCYSMICYFSIAWLLFVPQYFLVSLVKIVINFVIALIITQVVLLSIKKYKETKIKNKKITENNLLSNILDSKNFFLQLVFCASYSLLLTYTILFNSSASFTDFLYNSWQIASGYSSAMSSVGDPKELIIALSNFFVVIVIAFFLTKNGYLNLSLGFLFVTLIAFKHGFVFVGNHILMFYQTILFVIPLCLCKIRKISHWKICFCLYLYTLTISVMTFKHYGELTDSVFTRFNNSLHSLSHFSELKKYNENSSKEILSKMEFPEQINSILENKTVDIIPWDLSLVPSNNLNWQPRPIFQSYSAYTSHLDNLNYESYVNNPRDYLLYAFFSHGRHPFFDEPKTFSFVHCNYTPIEVIEGDYELVLTPIFLLEKLSSSRCSATQIQNKIITKWNEIETLKNDDNSILQAQIKINYSFWGKIYKTIFRAPPAYVKVQYNDDYEKFYRIIPDNANNGVIFSHLPRDNQEALLFLSGEKNAQVKSFSFFNQNNSLYKSDIEINLFSYKLIQ